MIKLAGNQDTDLTIGLQICNQVIEVLITLIANFNNCITI